MLIIQVAEAIERKSSKLEVNDVKTKVRRLEALPEYDETTPSRTVVALNLPLERPTIEAVAEIFSVCGEIVLVRILRPGKSTKSPYSLQTPGDTYQNLETKINNPLIELPFAGSGEACIHASLILNKDRDT